MNDVSAESAVARRRFVLAASAFILLITLVIYNRIVFAGEWLSGRDTMRVYLPLAKFWVDQLRAGHFPQWYPYDALGQPFIGMMVSGAFHPFKLFYFVLPIEHAFSVQTLLCYPIAALGTWGCSRLLGASRAGALFAGITYAFSGYLVSISNNNAYLVASATFPCVLFAAVHAIRRPTAPRLGLAGALLASIAFAGETQTYALTAGAILLLAAVLPSTESIFRRLWPAATVVVIGVGLAAPQLLPALTVLRFARGDVNPLAAAEGFSLHPLRLLELPLGPLFVSKELGLLTANITPLVDKKFNSTWVDSIAIGAPAAVFAFAAFASVRAKPLSRFLAMAVVLLTVLAVGRHLPVYELFYRYVPLWNVFRYPEKLVAFLTFVLSLGAGYSISRATIDVRFRRAIVVTLVAVSALLLLLALGQRFIGIWSAALEKIGVAQREAVPLGSFGVELALMGSVASGLSASALWKVKDARAPFFLVAVQGLLLAWLGMPLPQTIDVPLLREPVGFVPALLGPAGAPRPLGSRRIHSEVLTHRLPRVDAFSTREFVALGLFASLAPDTGALWELESTNLYLPAASPRLARSNEVPHTYSRYFAPLYGAAFISVDAPSRQTYGAFALVSELPAFRVLMVAPSQPLPRAYLAFPRCVEDEDAARRVARSAQFAAGVEVLLECGRTDSAGLRPQSPGAAELVSYEPTRVVIRTRSGTDAVLTLNDAYYPGWTATVDGSPAPIEPANVAVRAVRVAAGEHEVIFEYAQPGLVSGLRSAAAVLLALIIAAVWKTLRVSRVNRNPAR